MEASSTSALESFIDAWQSINVGLIGCTHSVFVAHPFTMSRVISQKTLSESSGGALASSRTLTSSSTSSPLSSTTPVMSSMDLYARVYRLLAAVEAVGVEGHHRLDLLLHLVWASLQGWIEVLLTCTSGRLSRPSSNSISSLTEGLVSSSSSVSQLVPLSPPPRWQTAEANALWADAVEGTRSAWLKAYAFLLSNQCAPVPASGCEPTAPSVGIEEQVQSLHAMVAVAHHVSAMQRVLAVVFLRMGSAHNNNNNQHGDNNTTTLGEARMEGDVVGRMLTHMVGQVLEHNTAWLQRTLRDAAELSIGKDNDWDGRFWHSCENAVAQHEGELADVRRVTTERNLRSLYLVHAMIDGTGVVALESWTTEVVVQCCFAYGAAIATSTLGSLSASSAEKTNAMIPVNQVLREALQSYIRLRATLLLFNTGTTNFLEQASPSERARIVAGLQAFADGLSSLDNGSVMQKFFEVWGVRLWLQSCEAVAECESAAGGGEGAGPSSDAARCLAAADIKQLRGSSITSRSYCEARSQATSAYVEQERKAWFRNVMKGSPLADWFLEEEEDSHELHSLSSLPGEGLPTLLYLLTQNNPVRRQALGTFSNQIHAYLNRLLRDAATASGSSSDVSFFCAADHDSNGSAGGPPCPLPPTVLEQCIRALRLTMTAFQVDGDNAAEHLRRVRNAMRCDMNEDDCEGSLSGGGITLDGPDEPLSVGETALLVVCNGLNGFFANWPESVALTLAHALHAHVVDSQGSSKSGNVLTAAARVAAFEVIDAVLAMASLLPSKEVFIRQYKMLMASRVLLVKDRAELVVDQEVVLRMCVSLGSTAAAPCKTLLRDLEQAMLEEQSSSSSAAAAVGVNDTATGASMQVISLATAAARAATLLPFTTSITSPAAAASPVEQQGLAASTRWAGSPGMLLRQGRVLCEAWWRPHVSVVLSGQEIRRLYEDHGFLHERIVDAVLRAEWYYGSPHAHPPQESYPGYGSLEVRRVASPDDARSASKISLSLSQSTSTVVHGISNAITKTVQQSGTLLYGNLSRSGAFGNDEDEENEERDFSAAYGGLLHRNSGNRANGRRQFPLHHHHARTPSYNRVTATTIVADGSAPVVEEEENNNNGAASPNHDGRRDSKVHHPGMQERRHLHWPLSSGQLTLFVHPATQTDAASCASTSTSRKPVQLTAPPLVFIVLQLIDHGTQHSDKPVMTFDWLCRHMPVSNVPRHLMVHLLRDLVNCGIVCRVVHAGSHQYVYAIPSAFEHMKKRKVTIDLRAALQTLVVPSEDAAGGAVAAPQAPLHGSRYSSRHQGVLGSQAEQQNRQNDVAVLGSIIEAHIISAIKNAKTLTHAQLFEQVSSSPFLVDVQLSPILFKRCIGKLIERQFLERNGPDTYCYVV